MGKSSSIELEDFQTKDEKTKSRVRESVKQAKGNYQYLYAMVDRMARNKFWKEEAVRLINPKSSSNTNELSEQSPKKPSKKIKIKKSLSNLISKIPVLRKFSKSKSLPDNKPQENLEIKEKEKNLTDQTNNITSNNEEKKEEEAQEAINDKKGELENAKIDYKEKNPKDQINNITSIEKEKKTERNEKLDKEFEKLKGVVFEAKKQLKISPLEKEQKQIEKEIAKVKELGEKKSKEVYDLKVKLVRSKKLQKENSENVVQSEINSLEEKIKNLEEYIKLNTEEINLLSEKSANLKQEIEKLEKEEPKKDDKPEEDNELLEEDDEPEEGDKPEEESKTDPREEIKKLKEEIAKEEKELNKSYNKEDKQGHLEEIKRRKKEIEELKKEIAEEEKIKNKNTVNDLDLTDPFGETIKEFNENRIDSTGSFSVKINEIDEFLDEIIEFSNNNSTSKNLPKFLKSKVDKLLGNSSLNNLKKQFDALKNSELKPIENLEDRTDADAKNSESKDLLLMSKSNFLSNFEGYVKNAISEIYFSVSKPEKLSNASKYIMLALTCLLRDEGSDTDENSYAYDYAKLKEILDKRNKNEKSYSYEYNDKSSNSNGKKTGKQEFSLSKENSDSIRLLGRVFAIMLFKDKAGESSIQNYQALENDYKIHGGTFRTQLDFNKLKGDIEKVYEELDISKSEDKTTALKENMKLLNDIVVNVEYGHTTDNDVKKLLKKTQKLAGGDTDLSKLFNELKSEKTFTRV